MVKTLSYIKGGGEDVLIQIRTQFPLFHFGNEDGKRKGACNGFPHGHSSGSRHLSKLAF